MGNVKPLKFCVFLISVELYLLINVRLTEYKDVLITKYRYDCKMIHLIYLIHMYDI